MPSSGHLNTALEERLRALVSTADRDELLWVSGYTAGLAAAEQGASAQPVDGSAAIAPTALPAQTLTIWYGTETGNARGVAERLKQQAQARGIDVEMSDLAQVNPRQIRKKELLALVMSTHGDGEPPETAEAFHQFLHGDNAPRLDDLEYSVLALGDSSYPDFCEAGKNVDERLQALGAKPLIQRIDCDVEFDAEEAQWATALFERLESASQSHSVTSVPSVASTPLQHDRRNPYHAEVLERAPLTVPPSGKRVGHVVLSLEDSGIEYAPGDSLGIQPRNDDALVDELLQLTGLSGDEEVVFDDSRLTLRAAATERLELTQVVVPFLKEWAALTGHDALNAIVDDRERLRGWLTTRQTVDVIRAYPGEVTADQLVGALRKCAPRLYSIASSPEVAEDEVHLTVRLETGDHDDRIRTGAASGYLLERLQVGDTAPVYVEPNPRFKPPDSGATPIIMVGPGTGVAPFRAFMQHREATGATGDNWLFFGEQHRRTDFLYQLDWQYWHETGWLNRLSVAFSRDGAERTYVQHRILEEGTDVNEWLERGAHFYVCGNGRGMAQAVEDALKTIIATERRLTDEQAQQAIDLLKREGRYQKDVY
ncbi:sulfite reductase [NADPH] flavoprotein alpha-component [Spiribacter sp. 2438]|uniref:diflavin oxidoreductase n=1 Tax=Spiribacter sp. 2438 TaxID=2666185 RepID=UPI0012B073B3|nr:flavodoxin domain-containing protein [Spiribacter sp. 2438]QGM21685.1 sulfite reductase [NADPH] flavoprotein alpha-component [Spiribacter sp. 2438]